jgi:hypothetical protein
MKTITFRIFDTGFGVYLEPEFIAPRFEGGSLSLGLIRRLMKDGDTMELHDSEGNNYGLISKHVPKTVIKPNPDGKGFVLYEPADYVTRTWDLHLEMPVCLNMRAAEEQQIDFTATSFAMAMENAYRDATELAYA